MDTVKNSVAQIRSLGVAEILLRHRLSSADAPPFIAHLDLTETESEELLALCVDRINGRIETLFGLFGSKPAVAIWCVAKSLSENYGEEGHSVYPVLESTLKLKPLTTNDHKRLREKFGTACEKFGLPVPSSERLVHAYLVQAGVSVHQLSDVAEAFLRAERQYGLPPVESTELLNQWEDASLEFIDTAKPIRRLVLQTDHSGYYASTYAKLRTDPHSAHSTIEVEFLKKIAEQEQSVRGSASSAQSIPKPLLIWNAGSLSLSLPRVEGRITLNLDDERVRIRGNRELALSAPYPRRIDWSYGEYNGTISALPVLGEVFVFDAQTGKQLSAIVPENSSTQIDAGKIVLLSTDTFDVDGQSAIDVDEQIFALQVTLSAVARKLATKLRTVAITAKPRPRLSFCEGIVAKGNRVSLLSGSAILEIETGVNRIQRRSLSVLVGDKSFIAPFETDEAGRARCAIREVLPDLSDPAPVRFSLLAPEVDSPDGRRLTFVGAWYWRDLIDLEDGFLFRTSSELRKLNSDRSRHLEVDQLGQICLDQQGGYDAAILALDFEDVVGEFRIPWPGTKLARLESDGRRIPLRQGANLTIAKNDQFSSVEIVCSDRYAKLDVRGRQEDMPFVLGRRRVLSMIDLAKPSARSSIELVSSGNIRTTLFTVVPAFTPTKYSCRRRGNRLEIKLEVPERIDAIRLDIESEEGQRETFDAAIGFRPCESPTPKWLSASLSDNSLTINAVIDLSFWKNNIALADILVRPEHDESFHPLSNSRRDRYAQVLGGENHTLPISAASERFNNVSDWMNSCFALESWEQIKNVLPARQRSLAAALALQPGGTGIMLCASLAETSEDASASWIPLVHPFELDPNLYSRASIEFFGCRNLDDVETSLAFRAIADCAGQSIKDLNVDSTFFLGFSNALRAQQGEEEPTGFSGERYFHFLEFFDQEIAAGSFFRAEDPLLGAPHYRFAIKRFQDRLDDADPEDGVSNDQRLTSMKKLLSTYERNAVGKPYIPADYAETDRISMQAMIFFNDLGLACGDDTVSKFVERVALLVGTTRSRLLSDIGFLLRLGPEPFGFFLLLWRLTKGNRA